MILVEDRRRGSHEIRMRTTLGYYRLDPHELPVEP